MLERLCQLYRILLTSSAIMLFTGSNLHAEIGFDDAIRIIGAVGPEGQGNVEAAQAWRRLATVDVASLPAILEAIGSANDLSANWLRSAVETIVGRELASGGRLPVVELGHFLLDTSHAARARRLAFDLIARVDPAISDRLLSGMINDPSHELRRDAVQKLVVEANKSLAEGDKPGATLLFQQLLVLARDVDQIDAVAKCLHELGQPVDLAKTLGFLTQWKVAGPFDSTGGKGFAIVYPPESNVDPGAEYDGKFGKVRWQNFTTTDEYGVISMNKPLTHLKGAAAYACSDFFVDHAQTVELRLGSENSFKVWVNGKFLFGQDEYHRNKAIDQYRMTGQLQAGRNVILVKVCQNEQTEDWADAWDFQLRVCDSLGSPIRPLQAAAPPERTATEVKP